MTPAKTPYTLTLSGPQGESAVLLTEEEVRTLRIATRDACYGFVNKEIHSMLKEAGPSPNMYIIDGIPLPAGFAKTEAEAEKRIAALLGIRPIEVSVNTDDEEDY